MSIGDNIRKIREANGIKSKDLAKKLGVSPSVISQWENTKDPAKYETLQRIAGALGVSVYDLYPAGVFDEFSDVALNEICKHFYKLNDDGKKEAVKRIYELTLIKKYTDQFWEVDENGRIKIKD